MSVLLRQRRGFEGFGVACEVAEAKNPAVSKCGQLRDLSAEVQSGDPARSGEFAQRQDRIAEVADVVISSLQLKVDFEALPKPPDSGVPSKLLQERGPLDLGVEVPDPRVAVVAIPRFEGRSYDLHVLLRHRPRSIPQAQESA